MPRYDTAVLDGTVVFPYLGAVRCDVGIRDGRIAALTDSIASTDATVVVDARDRLVLPGAVDSHFHIGIYRDLALDAESETASALAGRVTTVVSYFRTGQNYLNKSGPYRTIFPEVVAATTCSAQDFTPFAGTRVRGWPTHTLLRGRIVFQDGAVRDQPGGRYIKRPVGLHEATAR